MYVKMLRDLSLILPHDGKEPVTRNLFDQLLRDQKPDLFFDVGANVGIYSWQAKSRGVQMVFMFEADRVNARLLARSIRANHLAEVFLIPCAVSDGVGVVNFIVDNASGSTGSLIDHSGSWASLHSAYGMKEVVSVPTLCLDIHTDFCCGKKVVVKIDVEGAEELVFRGGQHFFSEVMPWVIVECFDSSCLDSFRRLGYQVEPTGENENFLLTPPSLVGTHFV